MTTLGERMQDLEQRIAAKRAGGQPPEPAEREQQQQQQQQQQPAEEDSTQTIDDNNTQTYEDTHGTQDTLEQTHEVNLGVHIHTPHTTGGSQDSH